MVLRVDPRIRSSAMRGKGGLFSSPMMELTSRKYKGQVVKLGGGFKDTLTPGILACAGTLAMDVERALAQMAKEMEEYAKAEAPWNDISTDARNGLVAIVKASKTGGTITLAHTVPYGVWLEIRWDGRYAIILPTIEMFGPRVMQTIAGMGRVL